MKDFLSSIRQWWVPHAGQLEFLLSQAETRILACGRRWGKTDACAVDVVQRLLHGPPGRQLLVAPTLEQAKILFRRACQLLETFSGGAVKAKLTPFPRLELAGHTVTARSGHRPDSLRGDEADHIVLDEAAFVPEALVTEVLSPMLATTAGRLTCLSTPNGFNWFWRLFHAGQQGRNGVWAKRAPTSENPKVRPGFLAQQRSQISARAFAVEYEAEFREAAGAVFSGESIERAMAKPSLPPETQPVWIGIDWAAAQDFTAVAVVCGNRADASLLHIERTQSLYQELVACVANVVRRYPGARLVHDATGMGRVMSELLRAALPLHAITEFTFDQRSKTGLVASLVEMLEHNRLSLMPHEDLVRELHAYVATEGSDGRPKFGAAGSEHDDLVTALMLAVAHLPKSGTRVLLAKREI